VSPLADEIHELHQEVGSLERLVNEIDHKAHTQRWRLQERVTHVEEGLGTLAKLVAEDEITRPVSLVQQVEEGSYAVSALTTDSSAMAVAYDVEPVGTDDVLFSQAQKEKGRLERSHDEVTAIIHYKIRLTRFADFEESMHSIASGELSFSHTTEYNNGVGVVEKEEKDDHLSWLTPAKY